MAASQAGHTDAGWRAALNRAFFGDMAEMGLSCSQASILVPKMRRTEVAEQSVDGPQGQAVPRPVSGDADTPESAGGRR